MRYSPDYIDISFFGDEELQRKLNRLAIQAQRKIVRGALRKAMKPVKDRAQALVPVKTGALRRSIKQKQRTFRGVTHAMIVTGTRADLGIGEYSAGFFGIGAKNTGFYPAALEFGYKMKGGKYIAPKSYLRRALGDLKEQVISDVGKNIGTNIEKEAKK